MGAGVSEATAVAPCGGTWRPGRSAGIMWLASFLRQKRKEKKENPRTAYCRIYSHYFLDNPLIKKMVEEECDLPFLVL